MCLYMSSLGKVHMLQCYVVIDHELATPTRLYGIAYRQSYSTYTVGLLIKAVF